MSEPDWAALRRYLMRYALPNTPNREEAEDVVSETFVRSLPSIDAGKEPKAYLIQMLKWLLHDRSNAGGEHGIKRITTPLSWLQPKDSATDPLEWITESGDDPHRNVERAERDRTVREALSDLDRKYRETLSLYYLGDLSGPEIAEHMGCSHGAVKIRLMRGRERLRDALKDRKEQLLAA